MRIALFALTGMGNDVVRSLVENATPPHVVVTRQEPGPYPHYPCEQITALGARHDVPVLFPEEGEPFVAARHWDLILVATYHRVLRPEILATAAHAINLHPSLLPRYRGPTPSYWIIKNGEPESGVTAHALTAKLDAGDVYLQRKFALSPGETEGSLRRRSAACAAAISIEVVSSIERGTLIGVRQDESKATHFPRPEPRIA